MPKIVKTKIELENLSSRLCGRTNSPLVQTRFELGL